MTEPIEEDELKYDAADLDALAGWLDAHFAPDELSGWRTTQLTDRYLDTALHDLARAGHGVRLRASEAGIELTVKSEIQVKGARHRRLEMSGPASDSLYPETWPASPARDLVIESVHGQPLRQRFAIAQRRRERLLLLGEAEVLASLDEGRVRTERGVAGTLRGAELELRRGRRRALKGLAHALEESGLVTPQPLSKVQIAHALVTADEALQADEPPSEAGRKVLARHLLRMLDREAAARAGEVLAIKQMRVAVRRMRSVWRAFDGAFRRTEARRQSSGLRSLGRRLGAVRDLDVLIARVAGQGADLQPLANAWREERAAALAILRAHLDSARYQALVAEHRLLVGTPWRSASRRYSATSVSEFGPQRIQAAHDHVLERAATTARPDEQALHALRIAVKRLRYAIETFRAVVPQDSAGRLIERLVAAQDALGSISDSAVAATRASDWLEAHAASLGEPERAAVGGYVARQRGLLAGEMDSFAARWAELIESPAFGADMAEVARAPRGSDLTSS